MASGVPWLDAVAMGLARDLPRALFLGASGFTLPLTFAVGRLPRACISSSTPYGPPPCSSKLGMGDASGGSIQSSIEPF